MKAVVATCFESNEERLRFVAETLKNRGDDVKIFTSDFSHIRKTKRDTIPEGFTAVSTKPYHKNLSLARILSHRRFAKDVFGLIREEKPDLIWLMAPANTLIQEAKKFKAQYPSVKLILDIIDMWPESLPISISKDILPFKMWRAVRKNNIDCCDLLITECDLYQEILKKEYKGRIETIHWARDAHSHTGELKAKDDQLSLVYIGSINNIIDTDRIASIISNIDMPVKLHVIGEGENTEQFLSALEKVCELEYHGAIRDEEKKSAIFERCHAGINIYKEGLYIGLTVKCIDYFEHGLPIINNIHGDTWELVKKYNAGINVGEDLKICGQDLIEMRKNNHSVCDLFDENLSKDIFVKKCRKAIDEVMK